MKKFFSKRPLKGRDPWKLRKAKNFFFSGPTDSSLALWQKWTCGGLRIDTFSLALRILLKYSKSDQKFDFQFTHFIAN